MRRIASVIALLLLLSAAAPVLACMTDGAMSNEESACCRSMHGNCGAMAKMGCCRTAVRADEHPQMATKTLSNDLPWVAIVWLTSAFAVHTAPSPVLGAPDEHSPPGLIAAKITVLRI